MAKRFPLCEELFLDAGEESDVVYADSESLFEAYEPKFFFSEELHSVYVGQVK